MESPYLPIESPSISRRQLLNFITGAVLAVPTGAALYVVGKFFIPPAEKTGAGGAIIAKDILGNPIPATQILAEAPGSRALVAGVSGEPTYLIVKEDNTLDSIGILDNCTHLGCSFPWNPMDQQFQCPCHGSRYAPDGTVVRGPAPLPLKIFHVAVVDNNILISPWTETDPRTGETPWWV
ncbi:cytochrome b6-f complex iron-sulfur subunit 1 [Stenomitos frigidus ULC18]|uniref:Cytochrome b6-f complex iron-sulfur subunit n=1 Tax=Stenomitos frigidus ULC18 TaxID=2107698 RepID=A0A2T1EG02_9CYAN|nr:cytochrome b6-f complex iron-sulfur subunit 1 [Stenomitos frigidus ULC18]